MKKDIKVGSIYTKLNGTVHNKNKVEIHQTPVVILQSLMGFKLFDKAELNLSKKQAIYYHGHFINSKNTWGSVIQYTWPS